ncbi:hypothetical protein MNBD_IGNAVI01-2502 [hydrothermal vent metagenome]|uniref:Uncharacterized protein n=1 Tax=hydrothermal vent metagenome TaxID=652676 RepID=A0A3B1DAH6_9ZZZZ
MKSLIFMGDFFINIFLFIILSFHKRGNIGISSKKDYFINIFLLDKT